LGVAKSAAVVAIALAVVLFGAGCSPRSNPTGAGGRPTHPNVLLVTLDTVRADRLGSYGYAAASTPALDGLARDGVLFSHAVATAPLTLPSHASILTGLLPPRHAVHHNGAGALPATVPTLAEALHAEGYRTAAFVGSFVLDARFGLGRGFELYDDDIARDPTTKVAGLEAERPGVEVVDRALEWLEKEDDRPFFGWVHLYDAHAPYEPAEPYRSRFADRLYDGEIAAVDAQVGRLLAYLEERGLAGDTVVAVAADHGEALGDHGELTHGLLLFEPTVRVPLLLRAPGRLPAGRVIEEPVGLADLGPTLAGFAGARLAAGETALDGRDLSAVLAAGEEPPRADLYAETEYPRQFGWSELAALRRGHAKYIAAPTPRLFDLDADPGEAANLLQAGDRRTPALADALQSLRERGAATAAPAAELDADSRAKLAALGYLSGATSQATSEPASGAADPHDRAPLFRAFEEAHWATLAGRPAEAVALLEPLVEHDSGNAVFRSHLARAHRERGDLASSLREYRRAFAAAPTDSQVGYELALALQASGEIEEATTVLTVVLSSDGARPDAHNALGILYTLQGQAEPARQEFERALAIDPDDAVVLNNLGNALRELGRGDHAADAYRRSIALAASYAEPFNGLGSVLVAQGRPAEALPLFDRALALAPDRHEVRLNRAVALELAGDRAGAIHAYRDFLAAAESDPQFAQQRAMATSLASRLEEQVALVAGGPGRVAPDRASSTSARN
jgi:arylsulfatase A-like enzyme/Tfp pilus assembly protein PilF